MFSSNTPLHVQENIKNLFQVSSMNNNSMHLGHPLLNLHSPKYNLYAFLKDKFKNKFSNWKADCISHSARSVLIKSVFSSIPIYYMSHILLPKPLLDDLTGIMRYFWWKGNNPDNNKKSLCLSAWKKICIPKGAGGLGFRDLFSLNEALITGLAWRMINNPDSLWAQLLKSKYFPNTSFWRTKTYGPKSWTWSSILKVRKYIASAAQIHLCNGNILIWNDPWCPMWPNIYDHMRPEAVYLNLPSKVSDLWLYHPKRWNRDLLNSIFDEQFVDSVMQIPLSQSDDQDILIWKPN